MEYVIIRFPTDRAVFIDEARNGFTNELLRVDPGTHVFDLGPFRNYAPESQEVKVKDTTPLEPCEIVFTRLADQ